VGPTGRGGERKEKKKTEISLRHGRRGKERKGPGNIILQEKEKIQMGGGKKMYLTRASREPSAAEGNGSRLNG